jgi:2-polyprenyl-3-methyl-5-hydroxy-6-metoxy-1,4-benzoquinol methylase
MGAMLPSLRRCGTAALVLTALAGAVVSAGQLAGRPADEWTARLERPERIAALKIDYIIASLALKPGQNVADIGAGPGILSVPMAKAVGPGGKVYAVEIDKDYFPHVTKRAEADHVTNVVNVLGAFTDPKLPARDIDVALFHDVLHHIEDRAGYLKATAKYVKPNGRIAIVELPATGSHKDEPSLIVTRDQVARWMADAGFSQVQAFDGLNEGKWFVVYARK